MSRTNKSAPSNALLHQQVTGTTLAVASAGSRVAFYGFLVEEPTLSNDPLYLHIEDASGNTLMTFEVSAKFGRDGSIYALKASGNGLTAKLSTVRTSVIAPAVGATMHIWYSV